MVHPVRKAIEQLQGQGACPRIQVNLRAEGVVCPDFLVEKWGEELIIDLDPSYPLDLEFTDDAVSADLAFGGFVSRCTFTFDSIYAVADRETGRGFAFEQNMPESVRRKRKSAPRPDSRASDRAAGKPDRPRDGSRRRRRRRHEPEPPSAPKLAAVPAPDPDVDPAGAPAPGAEPSPAAPDERSGDEAPRRRPAFSVIDGDG